MIRYDVIIVGAGPAGATAARYLSAAGIRVLLIEKYPVPRSKPCAGGLPFHVDSFMDSEMLLELSKNVVSRVCDRTVFTFRFKRAVELRSPDAEYRMVMRDVFDAFLVRRAVQAGCELLDGLEVKGVSEDRDQVRVTTSKGDFLASYVIGADGPFSIVARSSGLIPDRIFGWAVNAEVKVSDADLDRQASTVSIDFGSVPAGYAWIFPKADHLSCGIGTGLAKLPEMKRVMMNCLDGFKSTRGREGVELRGYPLCSGSMLSLKVNSNRILLAGDAACLTDPLTGEGIYYAMASGEIASRHLVRIISEDTDSMKCLDGYSSELDTVIRDELFHAGKFYGLLRDYPRIVFELGVANPFVSGRFHQIFTGRIKYRDLYQELRGRFGSVFRRFRALYPGGK
ncbi:MAG: hypothetical protein CVV64_00050 [Candidatus Wallbacteria bacterium HGW-Wallbacteria-1]|jgi:geranylgeranyl reductase family protein|uniref:FAD-binding domain-containing protein n=1 Tax=Candidatus Wallbacteria bacterium HGW-Wallbacteria-1 TaxID=2013854 RepID=A0A2N1PU31_9BACT|nr:MAG: hypothetical protein CVV64_00050 [Candidatus Wallbacteria bacterium HGW-Wallbacteria-1]